MAHSIFDLFKVGVGPSSSHTVGPMVAGNRFAAMLIANNQLEQTTTVKVDLYGSLALTGKGHATDTACILGLMAEAPDTVEADAIDELIALVQNTKELPLAGKKWIFFNQAQDIIFNYSQTLSQHPNGMRISAFGSNGELVLTQTYFSVGGGFVLSADEFGQDEAISVSLPYPFNNGRELIAHCNHSNITICQLMLANEQALGTSNVDSKISELWQVMSKCIDRGLKTQGVLPGSLKLKRRAFDMHQRILNAKPNYLDSADWVNMFAMAVNEENAAGGRVVTAPTNGAAGVIPAVLAWYLKFKCDDQEKGITEFLTTAAAIGLLYKKNASISAAEVGCQGEIGVACSMAAGALAAAMGGTPDQVENAAEIGMEHNLGLTCDPIDGLVQVPCIERNTMGAIKAINASRLALQSDGVHHVHLDDVIATMHQTGLDMMSKYKETSLGGLAINVVAC